MTKRDRIILEKLLEETNIVAGIIEGLSEATFLAKNEKQRAVAMTLINIGELVKNLTADFRLQHNQIPWKSMAGLRDVAAHGYFTLRMEEIWVYASVDLPIVAAEIKELLSRM
jgi:uncharacterized protein with HEPN domain